MKTIAVALLLLASGGDAFAQVFPQHMQRVLMCPDGTLMRDKCEEGEVTVICVSNNVMWPPRADASCHEEDAPPPQPKEDSEK